MRGPEIIARTLMDATVSDRYGNTWQYHPQSDNHGRVACWAILFDLLQASSLLQNHVTAGKVTFGINRQLNDWETGKKKNLDLVVARTPGPGGNATGKAFDLRELARKWRVVLTHTERETLATLPVGVAGTAGATVLVALEAKACMTAHIRALPRLYDELTSSHATVHGDNPNALSVGFVMINYAERFISPKRNTRHISAESPPTWSEDPQPHSTNRAIAKVREIKRRAGLASGGHGFDALGIMLVNMRNDGSRVAVVAAPPAPKATSEYHYDQMIGRAAHLYDSSFGHV